jgi:hypothetical protein
MNFLAIQVCGHGRVEDHTFIKAGIVVDHRPIGWHRLLWVQRHDGILDKVVIQVLPVRGPIV